MKLAELRIKKLVRVRICIVLLGFSLLALTAGVRLFYLQILEGTRFTQLAQGQRIRPTEIDAARGSIYDRDFGTLAISIGAQAVYAVPSDRRDPGQAAAQLAPYLSLTEDEILSLLASDRDTIWLERRLNVDQARSIGELQIPGIRVITRPQRFYPQDSLAANVLGFAGVDNQGLEGLEHMYDEILRGVPGRVHMERDANWRQIPGGLDNLVPPQHGHDLVLTIDSTIQYLAEREIQAAVQSSQSDRGIVVIMDPNTGAILANAIYPSFDPNEYQIHPPEVRRNAVVTDQYEPGSTFKIITGAAALDSGTASMDARYESSSVWEVGGGRVRNWQLQTRGTHSFTGAMENSDNVIFAKLAVEMGPKVFHEYAAAFGFGDRLGIDFPGESRGTLPVPGETQFGETLRWANIGFGQGIAVTPLQLTAATAAIANGGRLMRPYYVSEIRDYSGKVLERAEPIVIGHPISEATSKTMVDVLRSVVENGTAGRAEAVGFRVAGKTGTAEVAEGGRYGEKRIASFVGFAPADAPEVTALVALYNPKTDVRLGGVLAAPVFQTIMEQTLEYLGVRRQKTVTERSLMTVVPNIRNFPLNEAREILLEANLQVTGNQGDVVLDQIPSPGSRVPVNTTVNLFFHSESETRMTSVPDVLGKSMRDASQVVLETGLRIRIVGSGTASSQSPKPGTQVPLGSVIEVEFSQE